jgi:hypothetical protein
MQKRALHCPVRADDNQLLQFVSGLFIHPLLTIQPGGFSTADNVID